MKDSLTERVLPSTLSAAKQELLAQLIDQLSAVPGVGAIVLGGSYARGTQHAASDLDVALYYDENAPFAIEAIRRVARTVALTETPVVTAFYEWGAWVNGGAWLSTAVGKVDFLYRNRQQVERTIAEAQQGVHRLDYAQQPAYGFRSVIYLAETQCCIPLYDPHGWIADLKQQVAIYPPRLKQRLLADTLWSAEFTLLHARSFAEKGDVYNTAGCLTRAAADLTQALFALNETYFISDKGALAQIEQFAQRPINYAARLGHTLAQIGYDPVRLSAATAQITALWQEVVELTGDYQPKF